MPETLTGEIQRRISELIRDPLVDFVFPSQVAAESQARARCLSGLSGAVESSRFPGWDSFKESLFSPRDARRPANRIARTIWAARVLERQKKEAFLAVLTGPGEPSPAFLSCIASIPPRLRATVESIRALGESGRGGLTGESTLVCADLESLYKDYRGFLDECSLFEPDWQRTRSPAREGRRYILFAPELIEDFDEYRDSIAAMENVEVLSLDQLSPRSGGPSFALAAFPNAREEIRWVFGRISALLDAGVRPEEIAVTSTQLEKAAPLILRTAKEWGVPCALKSGTRLSATAFGRFLVAAKTCHSRDFDFPSMRNILLDKAIPWKNRDLARDLVRFGIQYHIHSGYGSGKDRVDIWKETFRICDPRSPLSGFHDALTRGIRELAAAGSFAQLRERLMKFRRNILAETDVEEAGEREVERVIAELGKLCETEAILGPAGRVPEPFGLFLSHLESEPYVPQSGDGMVPVYAYKVSALMAVSHHFILGCSEEATRVSFSGGTFLPETLKEILGRKDRDASASFMAAYTGDPGSLACFATEDFSGWSATRADAGPAIPPEDFDEIRAADPVLGETRAWRSGRAGTLPSRLCAWQIRAMCGEDPAENPVPEAGQNRETAAIRGSPPLLSRSGRDYSRDCAGAAILSGILCRKESPEGWLRLSASGVKDYLACPFSWLLKRALHLEEEPSGMGFFDNMLAGEMAHALIRELYVEIAADGPYDPSRAQVYKTAIPHLARKVLVEFSKRQGPFLEPMFEAYLPLLADRVARLVDAESVFAGWNPGDFEIEGVKAYPENMVTLEGRADRIAFRGEVLAIVDYKKKTVPRAANLVLSAEPAGGLGDCQIAAYVRLFEGGGRLVERAAFYSIENAEWSNVIGEGGLKSRGEYEAELRVFDSDLARVAAAMRQGDFRISPPTSPGGADSCENCEWKAVCRSRFATE